ncbi:MAG TPA: DegT/DnrJ/EryC1/StrS family aminotransferase [Phycisphaerales bacterium]|nr:DegT/DnrJ/EryC1/StrS family aminotransferase [Phycisphaerales bacterium]
MASNEIPLSKPDITDLEIDTVVRSLRSGRLSIGPMVEEFEEAVATRCNRRYGIAVNSGTSGLHLSMLALGIGSGGGDEVITTPFSFVASANCALYVGARPVFVDICPKTLNMDPSRLEAAITPRTKAIVAVECFGNPAYMDEYEAIAAKHHIPLIEDCCEALGSAQAGRRAGGFGNVGVFAFYPNKQITTGEGGMIVTDDRRIADLCRSMRNQGRTIPNAPGTNPGGSALGPTQAQPGSPWLCHERLGYNFRMPEMCAALGVAQMRRLTEIVQKRQRVASMYMRRLMDNHEVILPTVHEHTSMSWFVFVVRLASTYTREERDRIISGLLRHDVGAKDYFPCIHLQPFYRDRFGFGPGDFPIAETVSTRTIALPFYNDMTESDVDHVVRTFSLMIERENIRRT